MARPSKISPQRIKDAEEAMRLGLTLELAASYIGITKPTWYAWMAKGKSDPDSIFGQFFAAVKRGEAKGAALSLARIHRAAQAGTWQADAWLLERRHGYRRDATAAPASVSSHATDRLSELRKASARVGLTDEDEE